MIPGADTITVAPVGRIAPPAAAEAVADARQQEFQRSLAGLVGKSLPASVLSRLADGSFLVRVAGTPARMMLPANAQPGTDVPLTLVSNNPRPTFQVTGAPQSAIFTALAEPAPSGASAKAGAMQRAASLFGEAPTAGQLPESDTSSTRSTLSAAARVITSVLGVAARAANPQTAIIAPLPLLPAASTDPVRLAAVLKDAIGASGLFYESHLAEWSAGQRPLADLQREPQMQRAALARPESAPADAATAQFINLQLSSQEQGRVAWQGQLWPGQGMAWQISRDAPERQQAGAEVPEGQDAAPWRSALRLRFAALGEIGATVVLAGDQLHIQLQPGSSAVGDLLRARAGDLQRSLEAAGNPLASLTIAAQEPRNG
ncbi:MAG: Flagellar hook-length control protein FliK [Massilia sp.]|nr:Flagellar hook-length control protein FliK [Massilia sp.]